jgi:hypothetical protein
MQKKNGRREEGGDFSYAPLPAAMMQVDALSGEIEQQVAAGKLFWLS